MITIQHFCENICFFPKDLTLRLVFTLKNGATWQMGKDIGLKFRKPVCESCIQFPIKFYSFCLLTHFKEKPRCLNNEISVC